MSDITRLVNRAIHPIYRTVQFSNADANEGDVLLVKASLGRSANNMTVQCEVGDMRIRHNVYYDVFPRRVADNMFTNTLHLPNIGSGLQYKDDTTAAVDIQAGTTYTWEGDFPINDVELLVVSGNWNIHCS